MIVMERIMARENRKLCRCSRCMGAAAALALNLLPPHYYAEHHDGQAESGSPWLMVETAVAEALERIVLHPGHAVLADPTGDAFAAASKESLDSESRNRV